jgi:hypothetical protein
MLKCGQLNLLSDATNPVWIGQVVFEISTFIGVHLLLWKTASVHMALKVGNWHRNNGPMNSIWWKILKWKMLKTFFEANCMRSTFWKYNVNCFTNLIRKICWNTPTCWFNCLNRNMIFPEFVIFGDVVPVRCPSPGGEKNRFFREKKNDFSLTLSVRHKFEWRPYILLLLISRLIVVRLTWNQVQTKDN